MSKFKVTLRKNGKAVGEMSYGSEAVAVTKAKAMKDATGCDVTVAPAKANPRRAATRRRNGETTMWTVRVGSQEIGEFHAAPRLTAAVARKAAEIAAEQGYTAAYFKRWGSVSDGMHRHPVAQFLKNGNRRNGTGLRLASGSALEGSSEIGSAHDAALAARIRGELAGMVAEGMTSAQAVSAWMRKWESMFLYDPPPAVVKASQRAFVQSLVPKRNGHRCNPSCGCPKSNPAQFAFDDHFQRLLINEGKGWVKAPLHYGGSPRAFLRQIEDLAASGKMTAGTAARLRRQMKDAGFVPQSNPRRRRNGTTAGEAAASRSLAHRAGLMWNRRSS